ncbi:MAG TPA: universal stress protein [Burkholderiales bacterium]|nr:universal stress protein [Burkholderiales bacterium]
MYRRILVSTDGSRLSAKAIRTAAGLAKVCNAKLTGVYVIPPYAPPVYSEGSVFGMPVSRRVYQESTAKIAKKALAVVEIEAETAGVESSTVYVTGDQPWQAIIQTARSKKCDAIVMASHGRRGLAGVLLGSETVKVLTHSRVPVLVCR